MQPDPASQLCQNWAFSLTLMFRDSSLHAGLLRKALQVWLGRHVSLRFYADFCQMTSRSKALRKGYLGDRPMTLTAGYGY